MRTLRVYTYNELDDYAKQRAVQNCSTIVGERIADIDSDEYRQTLAKMEELLGINVYQWEVGYRPRAFQWRWDVSEVGWRFNMPRDDEDPKMLGRYLEWLYRRVHQGKYIGWHKGKHKSYHSKVLSDCDSFSPCGMWTDYALQDAMDNRYEFVREGKTIADFVEAILAKFFDCWQRDYEDAFSDENVEDTLANGYSPYEFYEDGTLYN